ncbi:hypothetical protein MN186_10420 [Aliiroseovarius sp. N1F302]|uniref:hypothetical protein n=1 Tax=Aliiroseovarius sediminis TaxID=2925839 RepID=UPI001F5A8822|nr:hypothetical protein [Aliiroseovarius sediminis]MCI2394873.1 hypothetical protein [Aliiroseovarius sediminis]
MTIPRLAVILGDQRATDQVKPDVKAPGMTGGKEKGAAKQPLDQGLGSALSGAGRDV